MGFVSGIWEKRSGLSRPDRWLTEAMGGRPTSSGARVNEDTALRSTAVYAAVRVLSETIASLPLAVYQRMPGGGKDKAVNHPLYTILHDIANEEMTAMTLRETLQGHLALRGNGYAEIEYDKAGGIRALWPLRPDRVTPERLPSGKLQYRLLLPDGQGVILPAERVLHIPGLSYDGLIGYSPIALAREAVGLSLATEEFGARFFGNGAQVSGVLEHPGRLGEEAQRNIRGSFEEAHSGLSRSHRLMILEEGMKYSRIGIPPEDAQFLETRKFQLTEIARIFRVPPHMLADLSQATFSNIEHQSIEFVTHTIRPWLVRWEQAISMKLLSPVERKSLFTEHKVDGLLRGDIKSRYEAYSIGRQNGWLSANDVRDLENMNPLPEDQGDMYLVPLNMVPADQVGQVPEGEKKPIEDDSNEKEMESDSRSREKRDLEQRSIRSATARRRLGNAYKRMFSEAASRVIRREKADVMRQAEKMLGKRDAGLFTDWLERFYRDHQGFVERNFSPVVFAFAEAIQAEAAEEVGHQVGMTPEIREFAGAYLSTFVARYIGSSLGQLRKNLREALEQGADPLISLNERFNEWEENRPAKVADRETNQGGNAFAKATYISAGFMRVQWRSSGGSCRYCAQMDGKTVGINSTFVGKGEELQPEGEKPLIPSTNVGHPPLHRGCDCMIVASTF
ncbi:phage portal protein, HK97 family [Marininema mesophilum]|uniref:Phage portal protein, HK97 family n=1 Tax=Marininema mesophilum TaxID=1048340 RepID=A0A1H3BU73_9BACL|nr:phage portal protein [Marininema mesophilum]SDX45301.1 phage portal protein, HK97 family [Marininema mesophilum]